MSRKRFKGAVANECEGTFFTKLPHVVLRSPEWAALSPRASKLLLDVWGQFRGNNNGDLTAAWSVMRKRGWRSKATLFAALRELLEADFLIRTRPGARNHVPALYAVSFYAIHACFDPKTGKSKHDAKPTNTAPGGWRRADGAPAPRRRKQPKLTLFQLVQKATQFGRNRYSFCTTPDRIVA